MKKLHLLLLLFLIHYKSECQEFSNNLHFNNVLGDKLSLHGNRLGEVNMYGFGIENSTIYYKTAAIHRWYVGKNADEGNNSKMELTDTGLTLKVPITSSGKLSLVSNGSSLGDVISLFGDRIGLKNMYGFGVEDGTLYHKTFTGYNWYINSNADEGISAIMSLNNNTLVLDGKIRCEEVKVEIINGQDYVFENNYELRTLEETKKFITEKKHLPEIPSAKEMEANGVSLGDMNMLLLKKIEELTLYQIELMEEIEDMKKELRELNSR